MAIKHPYINKPALVWDWTSHAPAVIVYVERHAKYKRGLPYEVRTPFATIRPNYNAGGLLYDFSGSHVVTRNSFDEIREFDNLLAAQAYVESLFALEYTDV